MNSTTLLLLIGAWAGYFVLHSALASTTAKAWVATHVPHFAPYYRLAYNLIATVLLIPPLWIVHTGDSAPLWSWHGPARWLAEGLAIAAVLGFLWSLRQYDMGEFLGLKQALTADRSPRFILSPFHRYVRHPWYFFALVIIWTRNMDTVWLVSCAAITVYFVIGSRLEERKLVREFGEIYRRYQQSVPALIPLPGRYLNHAEATEIIESTRATKGGR